MLIIGYGAENQAVERGAIRLRRAAEQPARVRTTILMNTLSAWLDRISSGYTIAASIALYILFIATVMIPESALVQAYAGEWGSPDGHLFYTPDTLYAQVATWGDTGRTHYVAFRLGLDPLWALTYTASLITITSVSLRRAFPSGNPRRRLNLIALLPMTADLTENALGITLVSVFPTRIDYLAWAAAGVSACKWITLIIAHAIMLYAVTNSFRRRG